MSSTRASINVITMGNSSSGSEIPRSAKASSLKSGGAPIQRMPKPEPRELERRFTQVLASMDLPPDKAKLLKSYDEDKKWDMVCDQELVSAKDPPQFYLNKLRVYLDPSASKSQKKRRMVGDASSTQTLRDLEISLRTNHIEWVREFLNEQNRGLDVLVDYLNYTQIVMRKEMQEHGLESPVSDLGTGDSPANGNLRRNRDKRKTIMTMKTSASKLNFGDATDDVHVCIMCLRAIMNHQYGFNLVFAHKQAINCIALSLNHKSMRTKALVLELLAAVCLVSGGHELIISSFDHFKDVCHEKHRFQTLIHYFKNFEEFHIDFMVACMQFINIVVHSTENMNFRCHLQHEFTLLNLDRYLDRLRDTETSDRLSVQINAYLDNMIDVKLLLDDSEMKNTALERAADLEEALGHANDRAAEIEEESIAKVAELETQLSETFGECERLREVIEEQEKGMQQLHTEISNKDVESRKHQVMLEEKMKEMELMRTNKIGSPATSPTKGPAPAPPPPPPPPPGGGFAPPPPPPPPPPGPGGPPAPPPPPGMGGRMGPPPPPGQPENVTIKKKIDTKYRLPVLNWTALKPNQVKGTVFSELDDEKLYSVIDFYKFEEEFKLGSETLNDDLDGTPKSNRRTFNKRPETISLLESNRLRNVAITRRKIDMSNDDVVRAINHFDLKVLPTERVEILMRVLPNDQELKAYREYERDKKPIGALSEEDKFMLTLMKVERLQQKLTIMSFIGNFFDTYHLIQPQLNAVIAASMSIKNSAKVKKMLEIILAFGNYMNSSKRGAVYGFKLQSLDMLLDAKSKNKKMTLLHFIVKTVQEKFPTLQNFDSELRFLEKAATVSLDNVLHDVVELEKGMDITRREYDARVANEREPPLILKDFLANSEDKIRKLKVDSKTAQEAYTAVVEYYGENPKTLAPNTFFSLFVRFVVAFRKAKEDLETLRKLENAQNPITSIKEKKKGKQSQEEVVSELKQRQKQRQIKEKKVLNRDEVYHGALEDILLDLKNEPYRRADALRRSQRRHHEISAQRERENTRF